MDASKPLLNDLLEANNSTSQGYRGGFSPAFHIELLQDVIDVYLYSSFADVQYHSDFLIAFSGGHQAENFHFT